MKLIVILTFTLGLTWSYASVYSQGDKLTVQAKNKTIKDVLKQIEEQSEYSFMYNASKINIYREVDVNVKNSTVNDVLNEIFSGEEVYFKFLDRNILLFSEPDKFANIKIVNQELTVKGKVTDIDGNPLPGVNIVEKGTTNGAVTNLDGEYTISVSSPEAILIFSYIGFLTEEIDVSNKTIVDVSLVEDIQSLEEVVVIGYGTMKKSDLTGSVASVKDETITALPSTGITTALQGRIAGVQIQQNTGSPGSSVQVRIRGANSIRGSNEPLWVIDGFPGDQNMLNTSDIESIEVLKDASATAIYGSRGANGVIIVTTKRGKTGATRVEYTGSYSVQSLRKKLDLMNAKEYAQFYNIQQVNDFGTEYWSQQEINNFGEGSDWQDLVFQTAPIYDHSLSVRGGNEKTQFSFGGSYFDQKGIIKNSGYSKITLRTSVNHDISKKFSISYNLILSRADKDAKESSGGNRGSSLISAIASAPPIASPYNDDGTYRILGDVTTFTGSSLMNPVAYVNEVSNKWFSNRANANVAFTIKPVEDLSIKISGNVMNKEYRGDNYITLLYPNSDGSASISAYNGLTLNSDNIISYNKTFNDIHKINVTAGYTYEQYVYKSVNASGTGFLSDIYETYNIGSASISGTPSSSYSKWNLMSYLGRLNYSYKGKYLATATFRADGSSRYSEKNKWGYFPSGALAYRLSEEDFMKNINYISFLKLRASYGESGSTAINPYSTMDLLSTGKVVFNDDLYTYFANSSNYPGDLKWETTAQTDVGVDLGFLENKILFTADYYIKNTRDLLNSVSLPASTGYTTTIKNIGKIQNKGFEFQLNANILDKQFKWDISANFTTNKSKVVKLSKGEDIKGSTFNLAVVNDIINLYREGEPFGVFYGYQEDGYTDEGEIAYKDNDLSGDVSVDDKTIIGDPNPDFIYSLNSTMSYKNFELSLFIQGTQGNDIYSLSLLNQTLDYLVGMNTFKEVLSDHWTPETPNAKYPYISRYTQTLMSDRFVYDGSYLRLKNIVLAYNLPIGRLGINWLKKGQIYISGQNLLTISSYPWYDPDVNSQGGSNSLNQGIDYYTYPTAKSITAGIKLEF